MQLLCCTYMIIITNVRKIMTEEGSFGEYYDAQFNRLRTQLNNKNTLLWKEWRERTDEKKDNGEEGKKRDLNKKRDRGME